MTWSVHILSPISHAKPGCINDYDVQQGMNRAHRSKTVIL